MAVGIEAGVAALGEAMASQLGGTFLAPGSAFSIGALALSLTLAVVVMLSRRPHRATRLPVLLRALFPRRLTRTASSRADIAFFVLGILFAGLAIGWMIISAGWVAAGVSAMLDELFGRRAISAVPQPLLALAATVILFLAYEFSYWLDHYTSHRVPVFWALHKVHHSAESLSLMTNTRVHPLETVKFHTLRALIMGTAAGTFTHLAGHAVAPFGIGGTNLLILGCAVAVTHLQHSHLWITFGPRWGRVVLGAAHHQIHHSSDPRHHDRNFGSTLALFDRLFGTFHMPAPTREPLRFGVWQEGPQRHDAWTLLAVPVIEAVSIPLRWLRRRWPAPSAGTAPPEPHAG